VLGGVKSQADATGEPSEPQIRAARDRVLLVDHDPAPPERLSEYHRSGRVTAGGEDYIWLEAI
jgi:hypothetical protein